jgi:hypothetical protein
VIGCFNLNQSSERRDYRNRDKWQEGDMRKVTIIAATAIVALATVLVAVGYGHSGRNAQDAAGARMDSLDEMHAKAHHEGLPFIEVKEPY